MGHHTIGSGRVFLAVAIGMAFILANALAMAGGVPTDLASSLPAAIPTTSTAPSSSPASREAMQRAHVFVSGRVQGVGFRDFTKGEADKLGVTGWVRNLDDGRVEAVLEGSGEKVAKLLEKIRQGPPSAKVDGVEVERAAHTGEFKDFSVRR